MALLLFSIPPLAMAKSDVSQQIGEFACGIYSSVSMAGKFSSMNLGTCP